MIKEYRKTEKLRDLHEFLSVRRGQSWTDAEFKIYVDRLRELKEEQKQLCKSCNGTGTRELAAGFFVKGCLVCGVKGFLDS